MYNQPLFRAQLNPHFSGKSGAQAKEILESTQATIDIEIIPNGPNLLEHFMDSIQKDAADVLATVAGAVANRQADWKLQAGLIRDINKTWVAGTGTFVVPPTKGKRLARAQMECKGRDKDIIVKSLVHKLNSVRETHKATMNGVANCAMTFDFKVNGNMDQLWKMTKQQDGLYTVSKVRNLGSLAGRPKFRKNRRNGKKRNSRKQKRKSFRGKRGRK